MKEDLKLLKINLGELTVITVEMEKMAVHRSNLLNIENNGVPTPSKVILEIDGSKYDLSQLPALLTLDTMLGLMHVQQEDRQAVIHKITQPRTYHAETKRH